MVVNFLFSYLYLFLHSIPRGIFIIFLFWVIDQFFSKKKKMVRKFCNLIENANDGFENCQRIGSKIFLLCKFLHFEKNKFPHYKYYTMEDKIGLINPVIFSREFSKLLSIRSLSGTVIFYLHGQQVCIFHFCFLFPSFKVIIRHFPIFFSPTSVITKEKKSTSAILWNYTFPTFQIKKKKKLF